LLNFVPSSCYRADHAVLVRDNGNACVSTDREVAQHVASRKRAHEQVFGIIERGVATKGRVSRAMYRRLTLELGPELARVVGD
jgi:hypothetical protein